MILEVQDILDPDVIAVTPSCRPWTVSANRRSKEGTRRLREAERPVLEFLVKICWRQYERGRGFFWEQPWGSAMWWNSPLACIQDIPNCRHRLRTDQCMFGCTNETLQQKRKQPDYKGKSHCGEPSIDGRQHAQLQGSSNGKLRTTQAAVYPGRFCKAIVTDIMKYLRGNKSGAPQTTYLTNHQPTKIYYKCERCRLGRAAPPGMEHTLVPRERRVASSLPTPTSSTGAAQVSGAKQVVPQLSGANGFCGRFRVPMVPGPGTLQAKPLQGLLFLYSRNHPSAVRQKGSPPLPLPLSGRLQRRKQIAAHIGVVSIFR